MKKFKLYQYYFCVILLIMGGLCALKTEKQLGLNTNNEQGMNAVRAQVLQITFDNTEEKAKVEGVNEYRYQEFQIKFQEGKHKDETYWMRSTIETADVYNIYLKEGDRILVSVSEDEEGNIINLHLYDKQRDTQLYGLLLVFVLLILIIGLLQGFKSLVTLIFTGLMIVKVLLPLILKGMNPILIATLVCIIIVIVTLTMISGFSKKTLTAILGTISGVLIAGIIALIVGHSANITGLANENTQSLVYFLNYPNMDFRGILFAGIIIGALGAVMDVSMSIASSMNEIVEVKPKITVKELMKSGMTIGRDIMGSMSNTLILAYTGGAIELMLLFMATGTTWSEIINLDMVAAEVIRAVAGSIGLAATIPLTVVIFMAIYKRKLKQDTLRPNKKSRR